MWWSKKEKRNIKKSDHTGPEIKRGMCWIDTIHKTAHSCGDDNEWKETIIPVSVFCIALAFNNKYWTVLYMDADELMLGNGQWLLMNFYHKNLPDSDEVEVVGQIDGCSIYDAFFNKDKNSDSGAEASDE